MMEPFYAYAGTKPFYEKRLILLVLILVESFGVVLYPIEVRKCLVKLFVRGSFSTQSSILIGTDRFDSSHY
jgi:hypothetical protein